MNQQDTLSASSRVALAAFLHDLGKFAERARLPEGSKKDEQGNTLADINKLLYCPHYNNRHTHVHAAYTAIAIDCLEEKLPPLKGNNVFPFASWRSDNTDDSLINAAAMHHKPETFLQWIIATADRVASGFERDSFEEYNKADEGTITGKTHYTARQITLMEQINQPEKRAKTDFKYRYALKALSVNALFPEKASQCEANNKKESQAEYLKLWNEFYKALDDIPNAHKKNLPLWLDHFETLWGHYTHAIPSATAFNAKPEVSLYDHSRTTAALATALWRYHHDRKDDVAVATKAMKYAQDWDEDKFLLIQGDFFGIQKFIFSAGSETNKYTAKLLRGRSFYVSLLSECAALKILDELALPSTSQVINAAGKFLIVAPNTDKTKQTLVTVQKELDEWFLTHTWGQSGISFAWESACCNDFVAGKGDGDSPFKTLITKLFNSLDQVKYKRLNLCHNDTPAVFEDFLAQFRNDQDHAVCPIDGRSPALVDYKGLLVSQLAKDQIDIGSKLTKFKRLMISKEKINRNSLGLPIFSYFVTFTDDSDSSGHYSPLIKNNTLRRFWDFSLPSADANQCLWNGYAKRAINGYVPLIDDLSLSEKERGKYTPLKEDDEQFELEQIKNLNLIACEDRKQDDKEVWKGVKALSSLKGDIDNLGMIFQNGLGAPTFTKMAALSRQVNAFFTVYLPWLCANDNNYKNSYTVFAGGDDFFLIGPWHSQIKLAEKMRDEFKRYVAYNEEVHFSVGLSTTKAGMPINHLAEMSEQALENAKSYNPKNQEVDPKNAVSCFSEVMFWDEFSNLIQQGEHLENLVEKYHLSTGYVYGLLNLVEMENKVKTDPSQSIWHSYFAYRTQRMLDNNKTLSAEQRRQGLQELAHDIAATGIKNKGSHYRVALFNYLYQQR